MGSPTVSVIVPVKNGEQFLAEALDSILAQDYSPLEILVVDGKSTDRTAEIARSYDRVRYIPQVGRGVADGFNVGIEAAGGELIAFLAHDDIWLPEKLSRQVDCLQRRPELQFAVCKFRYFLEPGCAIPSSFKEELLGEDLVGRIPETLLARRSVFETVGMFDSSYAVGGDVDWFARAKDMGVRSEVVPEVLLHKRVHDENTSSADHSGELLRAMRDSIRRQG